MKGELRKSLILESAKKIFAAKGYYESHVEEIIRDAQAGKGTFYIYFKNKEDLFIKLLTKYLDEWEAAVWKESIDLTETTLDMYYKEVVKRSLRFFEANEDLCNIISRIGPGINTTFESFFELFEERMVTYIVRDLEKGGKAGILRPGIDLELSANMIAGSFLRVAYYYTVFYSRKSRSIDIDRIADDYFDLLMYGILKKTE